MTSTAQPIPPGGTHSQTPLPLPEFTFPAPSSSAPSSYPRISSRRPVSAIQLGARSPDLPSFSFGNSSGTGLASPPPSPGTRPIPSRPGGHKRGGSELIGKEGGAALLSSSPTKAADSLSPGAVPRRKGHQHRRSAAISVSDVSLILKSDNVQRAESAPVSPATGSEARQLRFAEEIEVIPRPVSLVSSESSGTTIRPGHSTTGSLSSIVSSTSTSKERTSSPPATSSPAGARPKTASARLDYTTQSFSAPDVPSPRRHSSNPMLTDAASTPTPESPSTVKSTPKKWTFFGHDDIGSTSRPASSESSKEMGPRVSDPSLPTQINPEIPIDSTEQPTPRAPGVPRKSSKKKQKKVKSWAGSILSRKSRQRAQKLSRRSPTPPHRSYGPIDGTTTLDVEQPNIAASVPDAYPMPEISTDISSWVPRRVEKPAEESITSPIIDLDAALGPFNTPSGRDPEWDAFNRGSGPASRAKRMHSAAGMANFGGPGMHYHRRAASSPEFENPRFGIRHLNSSSTMADVFEEDEEDEWEDAKAASDKETSSKVEDDDEGGSGIDIKVVDAEDMHAGKAMDWTLDEASKRGLKRKGSGLSEGDRRQMIPSIPSANAGILLNDEVILEEGPNSVEIADDSIPPRPDSGARSSDSTATPPLPPKSAKDLTPVDIQLFSVQSPYLTPTSPHSTAQSPFPSPRSPFSYDTQRISTAPSSITDEGGFQSLLLGEPGPELRMSVDDVPSLTSSNSTMTRDSTILPMAHGTLFRDGQRSASLSSATATRKRSSMASLSRLISSSHGERSKLSIEYTPSTMTEADEKKRASKGRRISRMMQFWKPKDAV
jgi:hypothetical protein